MGNALIDQIEAARTEVRRSIATALGVPDQPAAAGSSMLFEELWQQFADAPRCQHLAARPVQPSHLLPWNGAWRCGPCMKAFSAAARGSLDPIEEHTCDRCRRYAPSGLTAVIVRQDFWVVTAGLCGRCVEDGKAANPDGFREVSRG